MRGICMHEMSILINMVKVAEKYAAENNAVRIAGITLQIGEMSSVVPEYVEYLFPDVTEHTMLRDARLTIEKIPATVRCKGCGRVYHWRMEKYQCPDCGSKECRFEGGREFLIKEIEIVAN